MTGSAKRVSGQPRPYLAAKQEGKNRDISCQTRKRLPNGRAVYLSYKAVGREALTQYHAK